MKSRSVRVQLKKKEIEILKLAREAREARNGCTKCHKLNNQSVDAFEMDFFPYLQTIEKFRRQ